MYSISTKLFCTLFPDLDRFIMKEKRLVALSCFLLVILFKGTAAAELTNYIYKYHKTAVTQQQVQRISRFNNLIDYFSGFSYIVPRHKVSGDFIRALILAESNANPRAVSNKGALGLGQIMLPTARQAGKKLAESPVHFRYVEKKKLADLTKNDLFDPAINILLTCYLIARYNHKFEGKIELVLSAWNAGEYTPSLSVMKHAPYQETENLIGKVNGYYLYFLKRSYY